MGTAASQRRMKRMKYLARLANEYSKLFAFEWDKRLSSWLDMIRRDAGRLTGHGNKPVPPVFDIIQEALLVLERCSEEVYTQYAKETLNHRFRSGNCISGHPDFPDGHYREDLVKAKRYSCS